MAETARGIGSPKHWWIGSIRCTPPSVSHGAPRVIPEVSECRETGSFNAPAIRIEGTLWRGSEPQIPIEIRWWIAVRGIAEALLFRHPTLEGVTKRHSAEPAALDDLSSFLKIAAGTLHSAGLDDAVVFARGLHHLLTFLHKLA